MADLEASPALENSLQAGLQGPSRQTERRTLVLSLDSPQSPPITENLENVCVGLPRQGPHKSPRHWWVVYRGPAHTEELELTGHITELDLANAEAGRDPESLSSWMD